jgi:hypothetical protein
MKERAREVDTTYDAFASSSIIGTVNGRPYYDELAKRGIISTTSEMVYSEKDLQARHPYVWPYPMGIDSTLSALAKWGCNRLNNEKARFAGPALSGQQRKFGVIEATPFRDDPLDDKPLIQGLSACGIKPEVKRFDRETSAASTPSNVILQLSQAQVNSIFCICPEVEYKELTAAATSNAYFPEWLLSSYYRLDVNLRIKLYGNRDQLPHTLGLTMIPRQIKLTDAPSWYAGKEGDPKFNDGGQWQGAVRNEMYRALLVLASGIQMAGPHLTPQTFAAALQRTVFPNPEHFTQPGKVSFIGDHGMTEDTAEWWFDPTATSPYGDDGPGSLCYVAGGARHKINDYPMGDAPFYSLPCDSGG